MPKVTMSATGTVRRNHAVQNLKAATTFAREAGRIEKLHEGEEFSGFYEDIRSYVNGSVLMSSASLEAYFNEALSNRGEDKKFIDDIDRISVIQRYNMYLRLYKLAQIPLGGPVAQNVQALIVLRNALVHPRPSIDGEEGPQTKVGKALENRFSRSPFLPTSEELFPMSYASYDCVRWAVVTVIDFCREFAHRLDIDFVFDKQPRFYDFSIPE